MEAIKLFTTEQIRSLEKTAIEKYKIPEIILMENAAMALFSLVNKKFTGYKVVICIGPGNNGGDGLALSRILYSKGWDVKNHFLIKPNFKGASQVNYQGSKHVPVVETLNLDSNTLVIDALFGTGLSREFNSDTKDLINEINSSESKVISADIPSGISAFDGKVIGGIAIKANYTVTFCANKLGLYIYPGYKYCGEIIVDYISIPQELIKSVPSSYKLNSNIVYPKRVNPCHKTTYGRILIISGSENYYGAPFLASKASMLSGSGYTTLCTNKTVIESISSTLPEVIYKESRDYIDEIKKASFIVYGPGLGENINKDVLQNILSDCSYDILIDGDGLNLLKDIKESLYNFKGNIIITPHPKEAARLLDRSTGDILENPIDCALELSRTYSAITVLKGSNTVIATTSGEMFINTTGSPSLSTAGSGDILCGIIAGLSGYMDILDAVKSGVFIHGKMGEIASQKTGNIGVTASNLLKFIPKVVALF